MSEAPDTAAEDLTPDAGAQTDTAAPDASGDTTEAIEQEALAMGWKPESQFKGPSDKFVSAAEYVERGKTIMPFLKKELAGAYKKIEGLEKAVSESVKHISRAEQRAYDQARRDLETELEQYAAAGDAAGVKAVTKDIVALEREVTQAPANGQAGEPPEFTAWKDENPWFGQDKALTAACIALGQEVLDEGYTGKAQIKETDRRLREQYPTKFAKPENPNRRQAATVEGAGSPIRSNGKGYSDLPAEAKAMCDDFVKRVPGFTRDRYVKEYFS